jgi:hypothetical protein
VSIDGCKRTGVVFDTVIASCELVNCASMQVQCTGAVPTVSVDKCDGCQVFVTAKVAGGDFQVRRGGPGAGSGGLDGAHGRGQRRPRQRRPTGASHRPSPLHPPPPDAPAPPKSQPPPPTHTHKQLVTAKSSEVNLTVVPADPNEDAVEHAVPEQFISSFKGGRLVTVAASHSGG